MRKLIIAIMVFILASCHITPIWKIAQFENNPFLITENLEKTGHVIKGTVTDGVLDVEEKTLAINANENTIQIPLFTDAHIGRTDSGVIEKYDEFLNFLKEGSYPFLINLGDLVDQSHLSDPAVLDFYTKTANEVNGNHLFVIGNHELHEETSESFDRFFSSLNKERETMRMGHYVYGPLSIYVLDNSHGVFGREQLAYLEEALNKDEYEVKIFLAHVNVASGRAPDHSFIITGMSDQREVHRLMRIMEEYGVSLLLTGHHHKGNIAYHFTENSGEFNAASLHRRDTALNIESKGYFYLLEIKLQESVIDIIQYSTETGEQTGKVFSFSI